MGCVPSLIVALAMDVQEDWRSGSILKSGGKEGSVVGGNLERVLPLMNQAASDGGWNRAVHDVHLWQRKEGRQDRKRERGGEGGRDNCIVPPPPI